MRRMLALACLPLSAAALAACGTTTTSTSKFSGAEKEVAQTVADLQSDVTGGEQHKICTKDLAAGVVERLGGTKACEAAVKEQLSEIDSTEMEVQSVAVKGSTATAKVKTVYAGKKQIRTLTLNKEGDRWKIASLQ